MKTSTIKTTLILAATLSVAAGAFAQGTIQFANINIALNFKAQFYDVEPTNPLLSKSGNSMAGLPMGSTVYGGALLAGTGYTAELRGISGTDRQTKIC